jgi:hypothetical protein
MSSNIHPLTVKTPYISHSFIELSDFCDIGKARWRVTNVLRTLKTTSWSLLGPGVDVGLTPSFIDYIHHSLK